MATSILPRDLSRKKTVRLGGFDHEFAADRFFDVEPFAAIVFGKVIDGIASFISVSDYSRWDARSDENGSAE